MTNPEQLKKIEDELLSSSSTKDLITKIIKEINQNLIEEIYLIYQETEPDDRKCYIQQFILTGELPDAEAERILDEVHSARQIKSILGEEDTEVVALTLAEDILKILDRILTTQST